MVLELRHERRLVFLTLLSAFVGTAVLSVNIGPFALFPFRLLLIPVTLIFVSRFLFSPARVVGKGIAVKGFLVFLLFWFVYAMLSLLWTVDRLASIRYLIFLFTGILTIVLMVYYFVDPTSLIYFYRLWLSMFALFVAIGVWEIATGNHLAVSSYAGTSDIRLQFFPSAVFYNTNDFATYIALSIPLIFVGMRYSSRLRQRLVGAALLAGGLYVLLATSSRANYLAVLLSVLFWFLFLQKASNRVKVALLAGVLLLALVLLVPTQLTGIYDLVATRIGSLTESSGGTAIRRNLLLFSLRGVVSTGGFGVGAGNAEHYLALFAAYTGQITNVHNWWMEILLEFGVWVLAGYVAFYCAVMFNLYVVWRFATDRRLRMVSEGLLAGLVGFVIGCTSSSSLIAFMPQWMYFGFALATINSYRLARRSRAHARLDYPI